MSDSDSGWQRLKRRKTKKERLMAALKAVMRDGSSLRSSRGRSRNCSRNNKRKGSKGPRSRQGPDTGGQKGKENQTIHETTHSEGSTHEQRPDQLDDTQGVSPMPQNAPRSFQPNASQGGGIGIHAIPTQPGRMLPRANRTKGPRKLHSRLPYIPPSSADAEAEAVPLVPSIASIYLHHNPTHVAAQLDFQNAFGTIHRKACIAQLEKHTNPQEPWFLVDILRMSTPTFPMTPH